MRVIKYIELPLQYDYREKLSARSALIGSFFILPWGYFIITFIWIKLPLVIGVINIICWLLSFYINCREYQALFDKKKFLFLIKNNLLIIPMNYSIKNPSEKFNCFLEIDLNDDVKKLKGLIEKRVVPKRVSHGVKITYKNSIYLKINLYEKISSEIIELHELITNAQGFTGSPIFIKGKSIEYHLGVGRMKFKEILFQFMKRGHGDGKFEYVSRNYKDKDYAAHELKRMKVLKDVGVSRAYGKYLVDKKIMTKDEVLLIDPISLKNS